MARIITFGEIMMRLNPEGYNRFVQAGKQTLRFAAPADFNNSDIKTPNIDYFEFTVTAVDNAAAEAEAAAQAAAEKAAAEEAARIAAEKAAEEEVSVALDEMTEKPRDEEQDGKGEKA